LVHQPPHRNSWCTNFHIGTLGAPTSTPRLLVHQPPHPDCWCTNLQGATAASHWYRIYSLFSSVFRPNLTDIPSVQIAQRLTLVAHKHFQDSTEPVRRHARKTAENSHDHPKEFANLLLIVLHCMTIPRQCVTIQTRCSTCKLENPFKMNTSSLCHHHAQPQRSRGRRPAHCFAFTARHTHKQTGGMCKPEQ